MKNGEKVIEMQKVATSRDWKGCSVTWLSDSDIGAMSVLRLELAMMKRDVWSWRSIVGGNVRQSRASPNSFNSCLSAKASSAKGRASTIAPEPSTLEKMAKE